MDVGQIEAGDLHTIIGALDELRANCGIKFNGRARVYSGRSYKVKWDDGYNGHVAEVK